MKTPARQIQKDFSDSTPLTIDLTADDAPNPSEVQVGAAPDIRFNHGYQQIQKILEDESEEEFEKEDRGSSGTENPSILGTAVHSGYEVQAGYEGQLQAPNSVLRKRGKACNDAAGNTTTKSHSSQDRVLDSVPANMASSPLRGNQEDIDSRYERICVPADAARKLSESQYELLNRYRELENEALYEKIAIFEHILHENLQRSEFNIQLDDLDNRIQEYHYKIVELNESNTHGNREAEEFLNESQNDEDIVFVDSEEIFPERVNEFSEPLSDEQDDEIINDFLRNRADYENNGQVMSTPKKKLTQMYTIDNDSNEEGEGYMMPIEIAGSSPPHSSPQGLTGPQVNSQVQSIYASRNYPWDSEVYYVLKQMFKLSNFRQNQKEAINATLDGKDVLVLMPTGGGKSLCYQLPALVKGGKTKGVTIVISPLISLMQDQVDQLKSKGVRAEVINSRCSGAEKTARFNLLTDDGLDLLYLSPEMLGASVKMQKTLDKLSNHQKISRFVIDEAHCVSSWGHDFRTDYKELEKLKAHFPQIPIMTLTATATRPVQLDIMRCLRDDPVFLKQTFNRPNLYYEVREKTSFDNAVEQIKELIIGKHSGKTGIIYCHSRKSCEDTCNRLQKEGLRVEYYHAGMDPVQRERVQDFWQKGYITTICATIAFGMGIDKPDVRYVIHLTLPQTMEGYYQETGRAGRDGDLSECILFYSYKDASMMKRLLTLDQDMTPDHKVKMLELFRKIVLYCEEVGKCRRQQILEYFEERFDQSQCHSTCDNCRLNVSKDWVKKDVTDYAKQIIELMGEIQRSPVPLGYCIDVFRGSKKKNILENGHDKIKNHGRGKDLDNTTADRIFHGLLAEGYLQEYQKYSGRFAQSYLKRTEESKKLLKGEKTVVMRFPDSNYSKKKTDNTNKTGRKKHSTVNRNSKNHNSDDLFQNDFESGEEMQTSEYFGHQSGNNSKTNSTQNNNSRKRKAPATTATVKKKRVPGNNKVNSARFDAMPI